ncbi:MAG: hypothetical protein WCW31_03825 [Patescibacteria group bacterium]|jgi:hypothetical protein
MLKLQWSKVALSALIFMVIASIIRQIEALLTMNYYTLPEYFSVWSKSMMPTAGPPPASFMIMSLAFAFVTGFVLAAFYNFIKDGIPGGYIKKVTWFTLIIFVLAFVMFALPLFLMINLPIGLQITWLISTFIIFFLNSLVFAKLIK